jgi:1-acyl-sn-glycerol-3-phosphate acyltransferase
VKALLSITLRLFFKIEVIGLENIPKVGKAIVCANHMSLIDPIIIGITLPRKVNFMAKKELFKNKLLKVILLKLGAFPVDRGGNSLSAIKSSLNILKKGEVLGLFPEGTRVKEVNIENAKPGISMISIKGKAPVIPICIDTKYKLFSRIQIRIGEPIQFSEYYDKKLTTEDYSSFSKKVMDIIYNL